MQLVHEFSGALLCIDVQERAAIEGFAMKVVLKTVEPPSGERGGDRPALFCLPRLLCGKDDDADRVPACLQRPTKGVRACVVF